MSAASTASWNQTRSKQFASLPEASPTDRNLVFTRGQRASILADLPAPPDTSQSCSTGIQPPTPNLNVKASERARDAKNSENVL
jgi:hypothetical protein